MTQHEVVTIAEAAAALNLSKPRVHQLMSDGILDGPGLPAGRKRHSPGAPRVTSESIERYLAVRVGEEQEKAAAKPRRHRPVLLGEPVAAGVTAHQAPGATAAARAAAQELKVRMDTLRDELRRERARNQQLLEVTAKLLELLRDTNDSGNRLDDVAEGYSLALTQLLSPDVVPSADQ